MKSNDKKSDEKDDNKCTTVIIKKEINCSRYLPGVIMQPEFIVTNVKKKLTRERVISQRR